MPETVANEVDKLPGQAREKIFTSFKPFGYSGGTVGAPAAQGAAEVAKGRVSIEEKTCHAV